MFTSRATARRGRLWSTTTIGAPTVRRAASAVRRVARSWGWVRSLRNEHCSFDQSCHCAHTTILAWPQQVAGVWKQTRQADCASFRIYLSIGKLKSTRFWIGCSIRQNQFQAAAGYLTSRSGLTFCLPGIGQVLLLAECEIHLDWVDC